MLCRFSKEIKNEGHIVSGSCEVYGDLNQFGDLKEDKIFQAVLYRRDTLEEDRRQQSLTAAVGASSVSGPRLGGPTAAEWSQPPQGGRPHDRVI